MQDMIQAHTIRRAVGAQLLAPGLAPVVDADRYLDLPRVTPVEPVRTPRVGRHGPTSYAVRGAGEPLVLIHGVGLAKEIWAALADELARDHLVVSYDLLGHGASALPSEPTELRHYADQLLQLMVGLGLPVANVIGHSLGALVALEAALVCPQRIARVAAISPVFRRTPQQRGAVLERAECLLRGGGPQRSFEPTIRRWFGHPVPEALRPAADETRRQLSGTDPLGYARAYQVFATSDTVHAERLAALKAPALFMAAECDTNGTPAMAQALGDLVPGSECVVVPEAQHMLILTHRARVLGELRRFLKRGA